MNIALRTAARPDRELIRRMMELYLYDFSEYTREDLDEHGQFVYGDLDYYWFEKTHAAFIVTVDDKLAGFVLVDEEVLIDGSQRSISEFFVMRKYRRQGVGQHVARAVFDRLPAQWEVRVMAENTPAQPFWRRVIADYTGGAYTETAHTGAEWHGPVFTFDNRR
jgi:predicted acetyltransferase